MGDLSTGTELLSDRRPLAQSLLLSPVPPFCTCSASLSSRGAPGGDQKQKEPLTSPGGTAESQELVKPCQHPASYL